MDTILLISPHRWSPKCSPYGLEHLAHHLSEAEFHPNIIDCNVSKRSLKEIEDAIITKNPLMICITIRNFDSAFLTNPLIYFPKAIKRLISRIRMITDIPIIAGGVSFSAAPIPLFRFLKIDYGIAGSDERSLILLAQAIKMGDDVGEIPGLVWKKDSRVIFNKAVSGNDVLPAVKRNFVDQLKTYKGGIENHYSWASVETKRGCSKKWIYCIEPKAKACSVRYKPPEAVEEEIDQLKFMGINWIWFTDSEFNLNIEKAKDLCEVLIRKYDGSINWGSYAMPKPFDKELVQLLERSGCRVLGIDAGHGIDEMLKNYHKDFLFEDVVRASDLLKNTSLKIKLSALIGGPGENVSTIKRGLHNLASLGGIIELGVGLRVYPSTSIETIVKEMDENMKKKSLFGKVKNNDNFLEPVFYFSPEIALNYKEVLEKVTAGKGSFMLPPLYQVTEEEIGDWRGLSPGYSSARSNDILLRENGIEIKSDASYS
jgi:radical SAM superfamily enzyme YgiQ (UPF0313 family)